MTTAEISRIITSWVADTLGGDITVDFGRLPDTHKSCMVRQVPVEPVVRRYLSGSGIYRYSYVVLLAAKTHNLSSKSFDAIAELDKIASAINEKKWPKAAGFACATHTVDILPSLYSKQPDGLEIYQVQATITYLG